MVSLSSPPQHEVRRRKQHKKEGQCRSTNFFEKLHGCWVHKPEDLVGQQVLAVINFPPRQVANLISEVLVLGVYAEQGVVLITPQEKVKKGDKLG